MCMYRCANETHTSLACVQRERKYSISWHILILSSAFLSLIPSADLHNICFLQDIRAAQLAGSLGNYTKITCLFCQSATFCRIIFQTSNQLHVSSPASMGARAVVLPPAPLLFSWQNSLSAELKAESVWHPGYIGASYQGGSMLEECFWPTWPCPDD